MAASWISHHSQYPHELHRNYKYKTFLTYIHLQIIIVEQLLNYYYTYFLLTFCAYPAWNDYNVRAINNIEGLPDKHVNQILQDSDGFMWFATNNGLCRYDGYEFKTYKSSSQFPELLQSNIVNAIVEDIDHNLWIGTEQGLHFLDKSTDKIVCISNDSLPNSFIHSLLISRDSTLWVGTQVGNF